MKRFLLVGYFCFAFVLFAQSQGGSPDTSFGENGLTVWDNNAKTDAFYNMALGTDGKIYLGGYTTDGTNKTPAVIQLDAIGQLNNAFGVEGMLIIEPNSTDGETEDMAVYDENVYIAYYAAINNDFLSGITKYNLTGKLDSTFGEAGIRTIIYNSERYTPRSITIGNEENVFVLATRGGKFVVMKMDNNGMKDPSFGDNGVFFYEFEAGFANVRDISLQADDRILIVGENFISSGSNPGSNLVIFRLNTGGNLDETFNETGLKTINYSAERTFTGDKIFWLAQEGKVMIIGSQYSGNFFDGLVLKLNSDGSNDGTFGNSGSVLIEEVSQPLYDGFRDMEGRYVVAGDDYIIRLTSGGEKDITFGTNGIVSDNYDIYAAAMDAAGNYLIAGSSYNGNDLDGFVARYLAEGISSSTEDASRLLLNIELSPNPFEDHISITIDNQDNLSSAYILIQNLVGQVLYQSSTINLNQGANKVFIHKNLSDLAPETYLLSILTERGVTSKKILKL